MIDANYNSIEKESDLGRSPQSEARRWKLELKLAGKRESDWRRKVKTIYDIYCPKNPEKNSFNILWSNTETLRQAVYNSLPQPEVRRRYQDEDELGKNVSNILTRALEFCQDSYDFDNVLKNDVLSMLLSGRGVSRVRYIPSIKSFGDKENDDEYEEIEWEQIKVENVHWEDFRILCNAKSWDEVSAIGFKHTLTRQDCIDKFGEDIGNRIPMDSADDEDIKNSIDCEDLFQTTDIWEIWDKETKKVIFISTNYELPCKIQDDPLQLLDFFPIARPLYAIENNSTLVPYTLFSQYEQQAKELNRISMRINKLIDALRVRGVYDATLGELSELMKSADNELIPAQNITALLDRGGVDKAIWMMPIDVAAMVLKELYSQRDSTKQIIYEITGIGDIMRSASDPTETFGAQKLKTQWGTQRLQKLQREVQRYIRDIIRLKAELICEKFQPQTIEQMTLVQLPHQADIDRQNQMLIMQYQQQMMIASQSGNQPPQPPQMPPNQLTWEDVIKAMRSDVMRTYHVDIETDSTLSASQDTDMEGLRNVLQGCVQIMQGFGPAIQQGAMSVDVLKELMLVVVRRAKMGSAVEDVINKIQQPPPPPPQPDENAGKVQAMIQIEQAKMQLAQQDRMQQLEFDKQKAQIDAQVQAHEQEVQAAQIAHQNQLEAQRAQIDADNQAKLEQMRIIADNQINEMKSQLDLLIAKMNNETKIQVAEIQAGVDIVKINNDNITNENMNNQELQ